MYNHIMIHEFVMMTYLHKKGIINKDNKHNLDLKQTLGSYPSTLTFCFGFDIPIYLPPYTPPPSSIYIYTLSSISSI